LAVQAVAGNSGIAIHFAVRTKLPLLEDIQKLLRLMYKLSPNTPYPWHSGSPDAPEQQPLRLRFKQKRAAHKSRKSANSKQNKKRWY